MYLRSREGEHLSRRLRDAFAVAEVQPGMRVLEVWVVGVVRFCGTV